MEEGAKALSDIPAINRFLSYCRIRTVPSKTVIIHAGDLPDILYYIISGSVEVMIEDEDGNEMVLAYLNKGQFFGEMGLFYEQPTRSAWVRTRQQSELAEMTYPRFRQIAAESPGLIFELATQLATRLDRTNRKLGDLAFVDVTGRVAHAIMDLCGEPDAMTHPEGMQIKVSRQELSRLVGCSREMAGRVLKVLEEQGLLRATGKTIVVFNARPKVKTRPLIVPVKAGAGGGAPAKSARPDSRDDDDEDDDEDDNWSGQDDNLEARVLEALDYNLPLAAHLIPLLHKAIYVELEANATQKVGPWRYGVTKCASDAGEAKSGEIPSSTTPKNTSTSEPRKRQRNSSSRRYVREGDDEEEEDEEDDDGNREPKRQKDGPSSPGLQPHPRLACPFHKKEPLKYSIQHEVVENGKKFDYRTCAGPGFKSIQRLMYVLLLYIYPGISSLISKWRRIQ